MSATKKPEVEKLFGVKRTKAGWVMVEVHLQPATDKEAAKVVKYKTTEPDFRDIALEHFNRASYVFWSEE